MIQIRESVYKNATVVVREGNDTFEIPEDYSPVERSFFQEMINTAKTVKMHKHHHQIMIQYHKNNINEDKNAQFNRNLLYELPEQLQKAILKSEERVALLEKNIELKHMDAKLKQVLKVEQQLMKRLATTQYLKLSEQQKTQIRPDIKQNLEQIEKNLFVQKELMGIIQNYNYIFKFLTEGNLIKVQQIIDNLPINQKNILNDCMKNLQKKKDDKNIIIKSMTQNPEEQVESQYIYAIQMIIAQPNIRKVPQMLKKSRQKCQSIVTKLINQLVEKQQKLIMNDTQCMVKYFQQMNKMNQEGIWNSMNVIQKMWFKNELYDKSRIFANYMLGLGTKISTLSKVLYNFYKQHSVDFSKKYEKTVQQKFDIKISIDSCNEMFVDINEMFLNKNGAIIQNTVQSVVKLQDQKEDKLSKLYSMFHQFKNDFKQHTNKFKNQVKEQFTSKVQSNKKIEVEVIKTTQQVQILDFEGKQDLIFLQNTTIKLTTDSKQLEMCNIRIRELIARLLRQKKQLIENVRILTCNKEQLLKYKLELENKNKILAQQNLQLNGFRNKIIKDFEQLKKELSKSNERIKFLQIQLVNMVKMNEKLKSQKSGIQQMMQLQIIEFERQKNNLIKEIEIFKINIIELNTIKTNLEQSLTKHRKQSEIAIIALESQKLRLQKSLVDENNKFHKQRNHLLEEHKNMEIKFRKDIEIIQIQHINYKKEMESKIHSHIQKEQYLAKSIEKLKLQLAELVELKSILQKKIKQHEHQHNKMSEQILKLKEHNKIWQLQMQNMKKQREHQRIKNTQEKQLFKLQILKLKQQIKLISQQNKRTKISFESYKKQIIEKHSIQIKNSRIEVDTLLQQIQKLKEINGDLKAEKITLEQVLDEEMNKYGKIINTLNRQKLMNEIKLKEQNQKLRERLDHAKQINQSMVKKSLVSQTEVNVLSETSIKQQLQIKQITVEQISN